MELSTSAQQAPEAGVLTYAPKYDLAMCTLAVGACGTFNKFKVNIVGLGEVVVETDAAIRPSLGTIGVVAYNKMRGTSLIVTPDKVFDQELVVSGLSLTFRLNPDWKHVSATAC